MRPAVQIILWGDIYSFPVFRTFTLESMSSKGDDREIAVMRDWIEGSHLTDLPSVDSSEPTLAATVSYLG